MSITRGFIAGQMKLKIMLLPVKKLKKLKKGFSEDQKEG